MKMIPNWTAFILAISLVLPATSLRVRALAINPVVNSDKLFFLDVTWTGTGLDNGSDDDSLVMPILVHWDVPLVTLTYGGGWKGEVVVRHVSNPHPGEKNGGDKAKLPIAFDQTDTTNKSVKDPVAHKPQHQDVYKLTYKYVPSAQLGVLKDTLTVRLTGYHVPDGGQGLNLIALGVIVILPAFRRKQGKLGLGGTK